MAASTVKPKAAQSAALDLVRQAEGFGVADGSGQHGLGGVLVSDPGEHLSSGDPLDDPPVRRRRLAASRAVPGKISSLSGTPGRQQPAQAHFPDGERVEQDILLRRSLQRLDALAGGGIEQAGLPGLRCRAGQQDQPGALPHRVIIDLQSLPEPDDPGSGMPGLAQLVAVHPQHQAEQRPVAEVPGDAQRPAGPARGGGQLFIGQQVPQRDAERHPRPGQQAHNLRLGIPGRDAGFQPGDQRP
jgi:hypothetical protein